MKNIFKLMVLSTVLVSCYVPQYHFKTKIYYLDGSTKIITYNDMDAGDIVSHRGVYVFSTCTFRIPGVDRFDVLSKTPIKCQKK